MLISSLNSFDGFTPLLIISSVQKPYAKCSKEIQNLFSERFGIEILAPTKTQTREYLRKIVNEALEEPVIFDATKYATPQKAKVQTQTRRRMTDAEIKELEQTYEQMLRSFRIFLRDTLARLTRDRRFHVFNLPVSVEDAEDYYSVITNPLSLSEMMTKIDQKAYNCKADFLADIKLIMENALEYNPASKMEDRVIRHNAIGLMDVAEALFDSDLDEGFEEKMIKTAELLKEAKKDAANKEENTLSSLTFTPRRRKNSCQDNTTELKSAASPLKQKVVKIDKHKLDEFVEKAVSRTHDWPIQKLETLGVQLVQLIQQYSNTWDRSDLPQKMHKELMQTY